MVTSATISVIMGFDLGRFKSSKDKQDWVDWLADDPVPASIRGKMRERAVQDASRPVIRRPVSVSPASAEDKSPKAPTAVSINISIPKIALKKPSFKIPSQLLARKKWFAGGVVAVVLIGTSTTTFLVTRPDGNKTSDKPGVLADTDQKADFQYSLPKGGGDGLEGAVRFDAERKVVNYKDSIGGVAITVSQQPLPEAFRQDTDSKVKKMAEGFSATKTIATANPTAYIGSSEKGPQTVIFSKKDLLVFIQSAKKIDDHDWAEYITNLK